MKQPVKNRNKVIVKQKNKKNRTPEELDGSKLETFFRTNILDMLEIEYVQQFEAKSIGRFYDFYLPKHNVLLEIDGSYWHTDPRLYESPINAIQKRNARVDKLKDKWALLNGFVLIRIWESDIKKEPDKVTKYLIERLKIATEIVLLNESKKNGSFFRKKI